MRRACLLALAVGSYAPFAGASPLSGRSPDVRDLRPIVRPRTTTRSSPASVRTSTSSTRPRSVLSSTSAHAEPLARESHHAPTKHGIAKAMATGRDLVARQRDRFAKLLPSSGYASTEAVARAVSAMGPSRARAVDLLRSEHGFEFAMRVPSRHRDSVASDGFLNQHDVAERHGSVGSTRTRARIEASLMGLSEEEFERVPSGAKPKYGFLRPTRSSGARIVSDGTEFYGDDIFVFRASDVKEHATVYPTDSLGSSALGYSSGGPQTSAASTKWHHALIPWRDRMMLATSLEVSPAGELNIDAEAPAGLRGRKTSLVGNHYLETQLWCPLGLQNVERFEFSKAPPSGAFLTALRQHGVRIFRQGEDREWNGDRH